MAMWFLFETLAGGILGLMIGFIFHGEYEELMKQLLLAPGVLVYAFGAWSTFQRNTQHVRIVVRLQLLFSGCLACCLPFAWLGMGSLCEGMEKDVIDYCSTGGAEYSAADQLVNSTSCSGASFSGSNADCVWTEATQQCVPTWTESMCETTYDEIEYVGLLIVIALVVYVAWVSHSFALMVEKGTGQELSEAGDVE